MKQKKNRVITGLCPDFAYSFKIENIDKGKTHTLVDYNLILPLDEVLETYKTIAKNANVCTFEGQIRLVIDVSTVINYK